MHQKASSKDCYRNVTANRRLQRNTQAEGAKKQWREKGYTQRLTQVSLFGYREAACVENPIKTKHRQRGVWRLLLASAPSLSPPSWLLYGHYALQSPSSAEKIESPQYGIIVRMEFNDICWPKASQNVMHVVDTGDLLAPSFTPRIKAKSWPCI